MNQADNLSPTFLLALVLSLIVYIAAVFFTVPSGMNIGFYSFEVLKFWQKGFWELLEFTLQMVLILIFGHALAISKPIALCLHWLSSGIKTNTQAVLLTAFISMIAGYINWGFGLILGAVLARQVAIDSARNGVRINYPLVAASGYLGMLVWHGGLSGSAPLKIAEANHFLEAQVGIISVNTTIFSTFNILVNGFLILSLFPLLFLLSKRKVASYHGDLESEQVDQIFGKDKIGYILGLLILILAISDFFINKNTWSFIDLNYINFLLLGLGLMAFGSLGAYVKAISVAVLGAVEILLQFPFYAGILGIMKYSGLLVLISEKLVSFSTINTFPLVAFFSAALVNFFIPSGGGQWAIQGPVMMDAALQLGLSPSKMVMVFAYGDQVSNMLQPFWALPLLAITGVPAKQILKYSIYFFTMALVVFSIGIYFLVL